MLHSYRACATLSASDHAGSDELDTNRDVRASTPLRSWIRALENIRPLARDRDATLPGMIERLGVEFADRAALVTDSETVTYAELKHRCRVYASWARAQALARGDVVCLLMHNCADYPAIWLGITGVGGVVALLNTSLQGGALAHAIRAAAPVHLITTPEFAPEVDAIRSELPPHCEMWLAGALCPDAGWSFLDPALYRDEPTAPALATPETNRELALLIYTSGTTGLPKAARISHYRILEWSLWFAGMIDAGPHDRLYDCLPLYHSTGGIVAVGAMLVRGGAVVIRERFSATRFWADIVDAECTLFLYIGELCRYLLAAPDDPRAGLHRLRLCVGNGLRGDVWERFRGKFAIPRILEFYASTEGNVSLYNCEGQPGAIGRIPAVFTHSFPVTLIRCDADTGAAQRGPDGSCIRCEPSEIGEAIGRITAPADAGTAAFDGYTDPYATEAKILRNVFEGGDAWFRTGDLMRRDPSGFYYFVDRLGDTFRWKGENVSTTQVEEVVSTFPGVREAVVYGVPIPGTEGRAGMTAIAAGPEFRITELYAHLAHHVPIYARPVFVRLRAALDVTGTFKPIKARLMREGWDPHVIADPLYFHDPDADSFAPLDGQAYARLSNGEVRL
jgi:fatty-acyl-CoA synthase